MLIGPLTIVMKETAYGVHLPVMGFGGTDLSKEEVLTFAKKAEELGYDSLSVNDHIVFRTSWLDALSTLSSVASVTSKIKLGTSILNIVIRNPVISAKALSSIDILSSGRLFAGVGPGSHKGDYDACGISFEDRWPRFTEAVEILYKIWTDHQVDFSGKFYNLDGISIEPRPLQSPHPPILIGSWGSKAGLKRVAKYGDGWMASAYNITPENFKERWKVVLSYRKDLGKDVESFDNSIMTMFGYISSDKEKVHKKAKEILAPALGRSPEELEKLLLFGTPLECQQKLRDYIEAGVKRIHYWPIGDYIEQIELFQKEIIP